MNGIIGYIGQENASDLIKRYTHSHKCGDDTMASFRYQSLQLLKTQSNINLGKGTKLVGKYSCEGNAPVVIETNDLIVVCKGSIDNYYWLKEDLLQKGFQLSLDFKKSDVEVLAYYIEALKKEHHISVSESVKRFLQEVEGNFSLIIIPKENNDRVISVNNGYELSIFQTKAGYLITSDDDVSNIFPKVIKVDNGQIAICEPSTPIEVIDIFAYESTD